MEASTTAKFRSHHVAELARCPPGTTVLLAGWVHKKRALGNVLFLELREGAELVQCVFENGSPAFDLAGQVRLESVVRIGGQLEARSASTANARLASGAVEVRASTLEVLAAAEPLPFAVNGRGESAEELRLRHRFLDLRRPELRKNILLRARVIARLRELMHERGFTELQTPILTSSSPEGARDFLVPSRLHPGKFYALPQAPQQFKQLYMVAGFERYFQIAPCFRDEDARADRSPGEFYQLDIEMAFVTEDEIFALIEPVLVDVFRTFGAWPTSPAPFPRIAYREAALRFASDKPDLRNPLEFVAGEGEWTRQLHVPGGARLTRSAWERLLEPVRAAGLRAGYRAAGGDVSLTFSGRPDRPQRELAALRNELGTRLGLSVEQCFRFCWVVDFPMYERDPLSGSIDFCHNPFSMPRGGLEALDGEPEAVLAHQYDIVCNGVELSSGAIRNHRPEVMLRAFAVAGYPPSEVERRFGALLAAFRYGAPPHGGLAPGIDRMIMLLANEPNLRQVIAFPLTQSGEDLLMGAPSEVSEAQLRELGLR
jgi:aspartyl-tRNA synthetase